MQGPPFAENPLLTESEASEVVGVSRHTLNAWRCARRGPRFVKVGARSVRYRLADLTAFVEQNLKHTTDQPKPKRGGA
jgi:predicted DNA-binding transcriptional regulator AlpA